MAKFISFDEVQVGFGLSWGNISSPKKIKSETEAFVQRHKVDLTITYKSNDLTKVGGCSKGAFTGKEKILSAAVMFASTFGPHDMPTHVVLVLPIENEYALIALENGLPYLDIIISGKDVASRIENLEQETGEQYEIYGVGPDNVTSISTFTLEDLIAQGDVKLAKLVLKKTNSTKLLVAVTLAVAGFFAYDYWEQEQARIKLEEASKNTIDPVVAYKQSLTKQLATASLTGEESIKSIWRPMAAINTNLAGWVLVDVECVRTQCKTNWKNKNGTTKAFEASNLKGVIKSQADGRTLENTMSMTPHIAAIVPDKLPNELAFMADLKAKEETARLIGVKFTTKPPVLFAVPGGVQPAQVPVKLAVLKGEISIEGPLGLLEEYLAQPENVSISHISMKVNADVTSAKFKIVGDYFVKH
jgi:hypothetical protein